MTNKRHEEWFYDPKPYYEKPYYTLQELVEKSRNKANERNNQPLDYAVDYAASDDDHSGAFAKISTYALRVIIGVALGIWAIAVMLILSIFLST